MRLGPRLGLVLGLLLSTAVLAGCTAPDKIDAAEAMEPGLSHVAIWVKRPIATELYPFTALVAYPHLLGFTTTDNDTVQRVGPGFGAFAAGWPKDYDDAANGGMPPADAAKDWLQDQTLWYEGDVPAGTFTTIRIDVHSIEATLSHGRKAHVEPMFGRLSFGGQNDKPFVFPEGETVTLVFDSLIEQTARTSFVVK